MTSTISSAKSKNTFLSMVINSIKGSMPVTIIYSFLLFIAFPLYIMILKNNQGKSFDYLECDAFGIFSPMVLSAFTVVIACLTFSIYHNKRSMDLYASLPLKRRSLFLAKYVSGLIVLLVPLVVFALAGLIAGGDFSSKAVGITLYKLLGFIISAINGYSMLSLFAMLCGGVVDTIVTYAVVNIGVIGTIYMGINLIASILPGFRYSGLYALSSLHEMMYFLFCPYAMPYMVGSFSGSDTSTYYSETVLTQEIAIMVIWLALAVAYVAGAIFVARIRKNENVQNGFIYDFPKVIIQFIASVGAGMILGNSFSTSLYDAQSGFESMLLFMLGAFLGALVAFLVVTLIYNRGIKKCVKALPVFIVSFVALAVFYLLISLGLVGGVNYVPDADDVKSVTFSVNGDYYNSYLQSENIYAVSNGDEFEIVDNSSDDEEYIKATVSLHKTIVENLHNELGTFFGLWWLESNGLAYEPYEISMIYELKNGKTVTRIYNSIYYDYEIIKDAYCAVINSDVHKQNYKIARFDSAEQANVSYMDIYQKERYTNDTMYDPKYVLEENIFDEDVYYSEAMYIEELDKEASNEFELEVDDTALVDKIYTSLREELLADDNLEKNLRATTPEYVETDNVPNELVYTVAINYEMKHIDSFENQRKLEAFQKENGITINDNLIVDPTDNLVVTKESYPKTWKLIDDYMKENAVSQLYIYS